MQRLGRRSSRTVLIWFSWSLVWFRAAPLEVNSQVARLPLPYRRFLHLAAAALEEFAKTKDCAWAQLSKPAVANGVLMQFIQQSWEYQGSA